MEQKAPMLVQDLEVIINRMQEHIIKNAEAALFYLMLLTGIHFWGMHHIYEYITNLMFRSTFCQYREHSA